MYETLTILSDDPLLASSPLVRVLDFLVAKFTENPNGIPVTKGFAFRRNLVAEAILALQWPDWIEHEVYHGSLPIKVMDDSSVRTG